MFGVDTLKASIVAIVVLLAAIGHLQNASAQVPADLAGSWRVTVEKEPRDRGFFVRETAVKRDGTLVLTGRFGLVDSFYRDWADTEISTSPQGRKLTLSIRENNVSSYRLIEATESSDSVFEGTYTYKSGISKRVKLTRTPPGELVVAVPGRSANAGTDREIVVVYYGAEDCTFCRQWEGSLGPEGKFLKSAEFSKLKYYKVKSQTLREKYSQQNFPADIPWVWERYQKMTPHNWRPAWEIYVDKKLVASNQGIPDWHASAFPQIQMLVAKYSSN